MIRFIFLLLMTGTLAHADGEVSLNLDQGHPIWWGPAVSAQRLKFNYGGTSANPGVEGASGTELAMRLISSSNKSRSFLVGLDLRQLLASEDGTSGVNYLGTKLGVRLEYRLPIRFQPGIGTAWFFGDTFVARVRSEQFVGSSGELFLSMNVGSVRLFTEACIGSYNAGSGFIILNHQPGSDSVNTQSISIGAEFMIESIWPEWLKMTPPTSPVNPF